MSRPGHIKLDEHETHELLRGLMRANELAVATNSLDVVVMAGEAMDMLIAPWEDRQDD